MRPNVVLLNFETSEVIRAIQDIDEESVVIILSFHRYFKEPIQFAAELQEKIVRLSVLRMLKLHQLHNIRRLPLLTNSKRCQQLMLCLH